MTPPSHHAAAADTARHLTDADAEAIASHMTDKLVERLSDRATVEQITNAWGGYVDRSLGRGLRRIGGWVVLTLLAIGALKLDLLARMASSLKP